MTKSINYTTTTPTTPVLGHYFFECSLKEENWKGGVIRCFKETEDNEDTKEDVKTHDTELS